MNKSLTKPLIRPLGGRWARVCLTALLTTVVTVGAQAQATCESGTQTCTCTADRGGAQAQTMTQTQTCTTDRGGAQAQAAGESGTLTQTQTCAAGRGGAQDLAAGGEIVLTPPRDLNSELRHRTWSFYTQGGLSWATGVWYRNIDAKRSYRQSAAAGGGVDFTIRPWVRVGAEYIWSRYRREQRLSALDAETMPVKAYGNYMMNLHNAKLGVGLNLMEIWPERRAQ